MQTLTAVRKPHVAEYGGMKVPFMFKSLVVEVKYHVIRFDVRARIRKYFGRSQGRRKRPEASQLSKKVYYRSK